MDTQKNALPDAISDLNTLISSVVASTASHPSEKERASLALEKLIRKYEELDEKNKHLNDKLNYLQKLFFGRKSEKITKDDELQGRLFNEAETPSGEVSVAETDEENNSLKDVTVVKQHTRARSGRKPIPADIPRKEILHDLSVEEKKCACCGTERPLIGTEVTEELEYEPAKIYANKHIYPKYGPCKCDESFDNGEPGVVSVPFVKRMLPGSIAGEGLLAYVFTSKFCDALPFYRLSKMFTRIDVDISRATMCNWQISVVDKLELYFEVLKETLKSGNFIRMDETTVQVLHEEGRDPTSKSQMWVALGYPTRGRPLVMYEYHMSRSGDVPVKFLEGFRGYLQTDGYAGYNAAVKAHDLIHVGCFAHARREFHKAYDQKKKDGRAYKALGIFKKLYEIESSLRSKGFSDNVFVEKRKKAALPVLDELHSFLIQTRDVVVPSSLLGQAVSYTLNEWHKLVRYLDLECMTPDNNEIERTIKSFVIGRKNWMFSNTTAGARSSAAMYSIIESAKANGFDPYHYLRFLFSKLPDISNNKDKLREFLPCFISPADIVVKE